MANAVAKAKSAELSTDVLDDIFDTAGDGASFDSSEMQIPFVRILQPMSPQLKKGKAEHIEGASQGDIFNNVTGQYWEGSNGIVVIPCFQTTKYLEFIPREQGGGFQGELAANDPMVTSAKREGSKEVLSNGNDLVKSDQHYCLIVSDDGTFQPVVIDMKSSQLKVSRRWKTQIAMQKIKNPKTEQLVTPAVYATMWKIFAIEESNDKGDYFNYQVAKESLVSNRDLLVEAKAFRESVQAGEVKAQSEEPVDPVSDDEIPF